MDKRLIEHYDEFLSEIEFLKNTYTKNFIWSPPESYPVIMVTKVTDVPQGWDVRIEFVYPSDFDV